MEFALFVYIAGIVGNLSAFFEVSATIVGLLFIALSLRTGMNNDIYEKEESYPYRKALGKFMIVYIITGFFLVALIPTQKTMYLMAGAYGSQAIIQSETAGKVVKIVNSKLDEYIAEAEKSLKK